MRIFLFLALFTISSVTLKAHTSLGLLANNATGQDTIVTILNADNSIYLRISLRGNDEPKLPAGVSIYAINISEDVFLIEVIAEDKERYQVSIGKGQAKFIRKSDKSVKFYTWTDFFLKYDYASLVIDKTKNPVREAPDFRSKKVGFIDYESDHISAIKIIGDWMKVKVVSDCYNCKDVYGWVKWKENGKIIINFTYLD
ncbi:hypothetical protein [Emticicia sp. TH156]|uniref:hypothetical protein n=1 Tax=Emticicia sp. TH156 TaxID=2067454 RepID=UPI000C794494|nr:hypothetical protein [Emticicia sp. TH156]PLK44824.1 hypothetical protein C0V77_10315 [Emticicia sp. TH156]